MDHPPEFDPFKYTEIFDALPLPATLIDAKGIIVDVNQASLEVALRYGLHINKEDRIGHHITQFITIPGERPRFEAFFDELLSTEGTRYIKWKSIDIAEQNETYWSFHARTLSDPTGRVTGALILREDISEQVEQERKKDVFSRVRDGIWKMKSSEDMEGVLSTVREGLLELHVPLMYCSVNIIDEGSDPTTITAYSMDPEGHWRRQPVTSPGTEVLLQLWRNEEPTYRTDLEQEDVYNERAYLRVPVRALVDVPFSRGTLSISSTAPRAFSEGDVEILQEMAQILSEGFQRMADFLAVEQRNRELEEKERLLNAYHQIGQATLSSLDLDQILDRLAQSIVEAGIFNSIMIALVDEEKQQIEVVRNIIWRLENGVRTIAISGGPVGVRYDLSDDNITPKVARTGQIEVIEEYDERFDSRFTTQESRQGKVAYFIPIKREDRVLAVLATGSALADKEEMLRRIEVMQPLLDQAAIALSHAQLYAEVQREITERQQMENALRESEARYRAVAETALAGIGISDPDENLTFVNPAFAEMLGYDQQELLGMNLSRLTDPEEAEKFRESTRQRRRGIRSNYETHLFHRDGSRKDLFVSSAPLMAADGVFQGTLGVVIDVTERKRLEEELHRNQNLQSLGLLAGGIAHDFNNMLTGITGNLALLERIVDASGEEIELVQEAREAANRTRDLTHQLMTFARGGAPVKETASAEELIRETTKLSLRGSKTGPAYRFPDDLWSVDIDRGQIGQVVQNLVINADQAMPQGGTLEIAAENLELIEESRLPLGAGAYVKISFADQGIGIPQKVLPNIFDPYFTTKPAGHGLGLAISHSIITRHGGHISVHSEQGVGTTFSILLPASEKQRTTEGMPAEKPSAPTGGRILLMDDDEIIHQVVGRMLKTLGYDVEIAIHGDEALQAYRAALEIEKPYDVVIMDLTIPGGMGGEEAVEKLHAIDPGARVIVSSGYSNDPVMANYADYGFCGMLRKPAGLDDLLDAVQNALTDR